MDDRDVINERSKRTGDTVAEEKERGWIWEVTIRQDRLRFVVAEITALYVPSFLI